LKSKVKFDFATVRNRVIPILKRVEVGDYPAKIGRIHGWSKQHVSYYLKKLQKAGLIRRRVRSRVVFYELTERGKGFQFNTFEDLTESQQKPDLTAKDICELHKKIRTLLNKPTQPRPSNTPYKCAPLVRGVG